jgi:hypothetical protein
MSFQGPVSRATVRTADGTELLAQLSGAAATGLSADTPVEVQVEAAGLLVATA